MLLDLYAWEMKERAGHCIGVWNGLHRKTHLGWSLYVLMCSEQRASGSGMSRYDTIYREWMRSPRILQTNPTSPALTRRSMGIGSKVDRQTNSAQSANATVFRINIACAILSKRQKNTQKLCKMASISYASSEPAFSVPRFQILIKSCLNQYMRYFLPNT